jgi:hypothetical protein
MIHQGIWGIIMYDLVLIIFGPICFVFKWWQVSLYPPFFSILGPPKLTHPVEPVSLMEQTIPTQLTKIDQINTTCPGKLTLEPWSKGLVFLKALMLTPQLTRCLRTHSLSLRAGIACADAYAGLCTPGFSLISRGPYSPSIKMNISGC